MEEKIKIFQEQYDTDDPSLFTGKHENMVLNRKIKIKENNV